MSRTAYRQERTLVRGLHRRADEDRASFKDNVLRLRRHFEQVNEDAAALCQLLMGIRPSGKRANERSRPLWEFLIGSGPYESATDDTAHDRQRLDAFELAFLQTTVNSIPSEIRDSAGYVSGLPLSTSAQRLLERWKTLNRAHRMILLKSSCEWIFARYARGIENHNRQIKLWENEKRAWEQEHPHLTPEARACFDSIYRELGIKNRSPRICTWERLKEERDDCEYAGEFLKGRYHSGLCVKYARFLDGLDQRLRKHFPKNAQLFLKVRVERPGLSWEKAMQEALKELPQAGRWFPDKWKQYANDVVSEKTIREKHGGLLPHCLKFGDPCQFNVHTSQCTDYRTKLSNLPQGLLQQERAYREWRANGFSWPPRKPVFQYPSARSLPMPKLFGKDFYEVDFGRSVVRLRLDDMRQGEYLEFGFSPWPEDYQPQPQETQISSVHVSFLGTKARVGFRFEVRHKSSRFSITQDDIDTLRRVHFPRASQDADFLNAVRPSILRGFMGDATREMRILSVDLGTKGGSAGVFIGKEFKSPHPLNIVKLDKLMSSHPERDAGGLGLSVEHVNRHLERRASEAAEIAQARRLDAPELRDHDLRRLSRHTMLMIRDWVRLNSSQIMKLAENERVDLILFESLRGFTPPAYNALNLEKKRRLGFFAYGSIRRKVAEKAVERGMLVLTVPYKHSSQVCSKCGAPQSNHGLLKNNKEKRLFKCDKSCGFESNSDENAAKVLARVFWGDIRLPDQARK